MSDLFHLSKIVNLIIWKGHPSAFIEILKSEKLCKDDGLIQRFMICAPKPVFLKAEQINKIKDIDCDLSVMFFVIYLIFKSGLKISLSEEAIELFNLKYTEYRTLVEMFHDEDSFIRFYRMQILFFN